jgi:hypothetical protein
MEELQIYNRLLTFYTGPLLLAGGGGGASASASAAVECAVIR